jgi:hypothetical protein
MNINPLSVSNFSIYRRRSKSGRIGIVNGLSVSPSLRKKIRIGRANSGGKNNIPLNLWNRLFDPAERARQDAATAKTLRQWQQMS